MVTVEPRMVSAFWACSPISFEHMISSWHSFLDPHLTTYHSNIRCPDYCFVGFRHIYFMLFIGTKWEGVLYCGHSFQLHIPFWVAGSDWELSHLVCDSNESQRVPFQVSAKSELSWNVKCGGMPYCGYINSNSIWHFGFLIKWEIVSFG